MLRGNHPARIDDKGRIKVPNGFRTLIEQQYGAELFVTSVTGEYVRLYPMAVGWRWSGGWPRCPPPTPRSSASSTA